MAYASLFRRAVSLLSISAVLAACSPEGLVPPAPIDGGVRVGSIAPVRALPRQEVSRAAYPAPQAPLSRIDRADHGADQGAYATRIPEDGVNMDAGLGVDSDAGPGADDVVGLAEEQDAMIAEGVGTQPVFGGIGSDNPVSLGSGQPDVPAAPSRPARPVQVAMLRPTNPLEAPPGRSEPPGERQTPWLRQAMPPSEVKCRAELRRLGVSFEDLAPIAQGASCGIAHPVKLSGLSGGIGVRPAVTLNCQVTLAFAQWVKNDLAPSARLRYLTGIKTIVPMGGYSCRRMNNSRQRYNPMSEHARGNAIDIGAVVLKDGHKIDVRSKSIFSLRERGLLKAVRSDSCKYFSTVLGPGSNAEHADHFHFDLRSRKGDRRHCD